MISERRWILARKAVRWTLMKDKSPRTQARCRWRSMKIRCFDPTCVDYPNYGGRGITVCERWLTFENFLADMGPPPSGLTLERKDNALGYSPDNCIWASHTVQNRNRKTTQMVHYNGTDVSLLELCESLGLRTKTIRMRLSKGYSLELALYAGKYRAGTPTGSYPRPKAEAPSLHKETEAVQWWLPGPPPLE